MSKRAITVSAAALTLVVVGVVIASLAARRKAESVQCGNYMASIGCAAWLRAEDHDGHLPSDLHSMSSGLVTPKILVCRGDHSPQPASSEASRDPFNRGSAFRFKTCRVSHTPN